MNEDSSSEEYILTVNTESVGKGVLQISIRSWMINDRLLLNEDKTEVLLIGTQYQLNKLDRSSCLRVGDNDIRSVDIRSVA